MDLETYEEYMETLEELGMLHLEGLVTATEDKIGNAEAIPSLPLPENCSLEKIVENVGGREYVKSHISGAFAEIFAYEIWNSLKEALPNIEIPQTRGAGGMSYQKGFDGKHVYEVDEPIVNINAWAQLSAFDILIGNQDRHDDNLFLKENGDIVAIDNASGFDEFSEFDTLNNPQSYLPSRSPAYPLRRHPHPKTGCRRRQ